MKPLKWFGIILLYTAFTLLCVYLIPNGSFLSAITYVFGFIYVASVPGYCLVYLLFEEGKLDLPETIVLSVALSFSLAATLGLFLGLSPIGINVNSITISLSIIVVVLAALATAKKMGLLRKKRTGTCQTALMR